MKALGTLRNHLIGKRGIVALLLAAAGFVGLSAAEAAAPASIERELQLRAPKLLESCRAKGYKNIGVLKFRVKVGDGAITDNIGVLNSVIATRLELALILANDVDNPVGIVKDASSILAGDKQASHLTTEGQKRLFAHAYPLAWGKEKVVPDAFFTGLVKFSADMRDMSVQLCAIANDGKGIYRCMEEFKATPSTFTLTESGGSFLRSIGGAQKDTAASKDREQRGEKVKPAGPTTPEVPGKKTDELPGAKPGLEKNPIEDPSAPIALEVRYDNQPVAYKVAGNDARIHEPQEGQQVDLILKRLTKQPGRLGIVVKVNGENTLFRQKEADLFCSKWLLDPGDAPVRIIGFKLDEKLTNPFVVLSLEESKAGELKYGKDVGMITLTVFKQKEGVALNPGGAPPIAPRPPPATPPAKPEAKKPAPEANPPAAKNPAPAGENTPAPPGDLPGDPPPGSPEESSPLRSIRKGVYPESKARTPASLVELKYLIEKGLSNPVRNVFAGSGAVVQDEIQFEKFEADPTPIMILAIRYYKGK